jgi:hypothetical protein
VKDIAAKKKIPRTTFQEHLQKAESKLLSSLMPFLQLYVHIPLEVKQRRAVPALS